MTSFSISNQELQKYETMSTSIETVTTAVNHLSIAYQNGGSSDKTATFYSNWAKDNNYDEHLNENLYRGPKIAAEAVADYFNTSTRANVKVLDVAAGTGFVAEHLKEHGFKHIDALDPSVGMLELARKKNLYEHFITSYLDSNPLPTLPDTYDCAVTSGGMGEGHIPYSSLDQLVRVVKPGGLICIVMREEYLNHGQYKDLLEPYMKTLEEEGKWQLDSRTIAPHYCFDHNGIVYKYKVLAGNTENKLMTGNNESTTS